MQGSAKVLDGDEVARAVKRIAHEIAEQQDSGEIALIGVQRRGAVVARRLHPLVSSLADVPVKLGELDISLYRDDVASRPAAPIVHATHIDFPVGGTTVVIVDDVLYTGRTVRAAIDAVFDYGRPDRIRLAVLCDRGHRELPIRPDHVGKNIPTRSSDQVRVRMVELDGVDEVTIESGPEVAKW